MSNSIEKQDPKEISESEVIDKWVQRGLAYLIGVPSLILSIIYDRTYLTISCVLLLTGIIGYKIIKKLKDDPLVVLELETSDNSILYSIPESEASEISMISDTISKKHEITSNDFEVSEELFTKSVEETSSEIATIPEEKETIIEKISNIVEEAKMSNGKQDYGKILVRRFLNLNEYDRDQVLKNLELNIPPLIFTEENALNREIFQRVVDRELLECFWAEVEKKHGDNMFTENPYKSEEKI